MTDRDIKGRFAKGHSQCNTGKTWFKKGHSNYNKELKGCFNKGNHSKTEFKKGHIATHRMPKGKEHWNWQGGISEYPRRGLLRRHRRIILIHNPDCEICSRPANVVHHKDFTKSNHKLSNLIALCYSCHSKIHQGSLELALGSHK